MRKSRIHFLMLLVTVAGCGPAGPPLAVVEGTVTLDGEPVADAMVEFIPLTAEGSPSYSINKTDQNGRFEMGYNAERAGVLPGKYKVSISTFDQIMNENGSMTDIPERIPEKYNLDTELEHDITEGKHDIPFELTSK